MQKLLKPAEVADRLSVSRAWVYEAAKVGRIPAIRIGGEDGPLRFVAQDVEDWARRGVIPSRKVGRRRLYLRPNIEALLLEERS